MELNFLLLYEVSLRLHLAEGDVLDHCNLTTTSFVPPSSVDTASALYGAAFCELFWLLIAVVILIFVSCVISCCLARWVLQ